MAELAVRRRDSLRPGIFAFWQNDGPISKEDRLNNIKLIAKEVLPAVQQIGKELNLTSPFEVAPGSRPLPASGKPESVGSIEPLLRFREHEGELSERLPASGEGRITRQNRSSGGHINGSDGAQNC